MDADAALTSVYEACANAGPDACPLYNSSTNLVKERVDTLLNNIHTNPVPVFNASSVVSVTSVIDYTMVTNKLFLALIGPYTFMKDFFTALADLEKGNGTLMQAIQPIATTSIDALLSCDQDPSSPFVSTTTEIEYAIACGDKVNPGTLTFEQVESLYQDGLRVSKDFGPVYNGYLTGCSWPIATADPFNASFTQNTSFPLMFIGNTLDPITSIQYARNMSAGFSGSVVLELNITGHTSLAALTDCGALSVSAYFQNGTLPEIGTVCQYNGTIFGPAISA